VFVAAQAKIKSGVILSFGRQAAAGAGFYDERCAGIASSRTMYLTLSTAFSLGMNASPPSLRRT
jgi:hypothetical protein